jgi:hypothetical protein
MRTPLLVLSLLGGGVAPALAEPALVDQVERLDTEPGAFEVEWQSIFADRTDDEERTAIHILSGEYGLTDRISLGFELGAEDEDGEAIEAEYLLMQAKFIALDPRQSPVGFGVQASIGPSLNGGEAEAELELLGETRLGALVFAADIAIEAELDALDDAATRYAVRSDWTHHWGVLGLEAGGDIDPAIDEEARAWIGPLVAFEASEAFVVELSYLRGLNDETPDDQVRLQLGAAF